MRVSVKKRECPFEGGGLPFETGINIIRVKGRPLTGRKEDFMSGKTFIAMDIQLFAEGSGESAADGEVASPETQESNPLPVGEEETSAEETASFEDLEKEYNELIKGKFRDIHKEKIQNIIKDRLKNSKNEEKQLKKLAEIVGKRYGLKQEDLSLADYVRKVYDSVIADDDQFEQLAIEMGVTPEQARKAYLTEMRLSEANEKIEEYESEKRQREMFSKWREEETELRKKYPSFNLAEELKNPAFASLMDNPYITMEGAYNAVHANERVMAAIKAATETTERNISNKIAAGKSRPSENGVSSNSSTISKIDVRNMTDEQRQDIIRRARRGERVVLG